MLPSIKLVVLVRSCSFSSLVDVESIEDVLLQREGPRIFFYISLGFKQGIRICLEVAYVKLYIEQEKIFEPFIVGLQFRNFVDLH
jgi:hypothetical protein